MINLLILTNEAAVDSPHGLVDGFHVLTDSGEISSVDREPTFPAPFETIEQRDQRVLTRLGRNDYSHVLLLNPGEFPANPTSQERMFDAIGARSIFFWEGDAWGSRKQRPLAARRWIRASNVVFTVAGEPQTTDLLALGAPIVAQTLHTYSHSVFREDSLPFRSDTGRGACLIGSQLIRLVPRSAIPLAGVSGLPGSFGRWQVASMLRRRLGDQMKVFGAGWPTAWNTTSIPYHQIVDVIQNHAVLANWDHFPTMGDYSSDRLPVALLAGRPQVTTKHPGMEWLPGEGVGVYQETTPKAAVERTLTLLDEGSHGPGQAAAAEGRHWVLNRLSSREAARHMLSMVDTRVKPPPADPWALLPITRTNLRSG